MTFRLLTLRVKVHFNLFCFCLCRSGKGAVHIWNLNTRRAEKFLDGHGGTSVIWVSTLQTAENLIRWGSMWGNLQYLKLFFWPTLACCGSVGSSQARDMRLCVWDLSEGRSQVMDSLWTGSVGFCQGSLLHSSSGSFLLAFPGEQTEEVRHHWVF